MMPFVYLVLILSDLQTSQTSQAVFLQRQLCALGARRRYG